MPIKQTVPTNSGDYVQFGNATTPVAAQVGGYEDSTGNGHLELYTTAGGTVTEQVRVTSAGNVGIGTASPVSKLHVASTGQIITASGNSSANQSADIQINRTSSSTTIQSAPNITFGDGTVNNTWAMQAGSGNLQFFNYQSSWLERMRIDSSGNVLVGTTSVRGKFNNVAASSQGSGYNAFFQNTWSGDVSTAALYVAKFDNNSTTSQQFVRFSINNDATGSGQINANGASAAAFGSFSDKRLKENITDLPSQLNNIMALRPVEFDYIASEGGGHQIGFIAQEVKEIYPDLIGEREDGMFTLTDMNKNDARLIKCIQELKAIIDTQAERIAVLEAK